MRNVLRKIIPGFIWKLDHYLLVHRPLLWSSRLHYLLYFQVIIVGISLLLASIPRIDFNNLPDPQWILIYGIFANIIIGIAWLSYQALFELKYFHGTRIILHNVRVVVIFFIVFLVVVASSLIPYWYLNKRIINAVVDTNLPLPIMDNNYPGYNSGVDYMVDTVATVAVTDTIANDTVQNRYKYLAEVQDTINNLDSAQRVNLEISLGGKDIAYLESFQIINNPTTQFIRYIVYLEDPQRIVRGIQDTLTVFYNNIITQDSIYSEKFSKYVYHRVIMAHLDVANRDSLIEKYYYPRTGAPGFAIEDRNTIQSSLIGERISREEARATNSAYDPIYSDRGYALSRAMNFVNSELYAYALEFLNNCAALGSLILLVIAIVRFFGVRTLLLGLIAPCLLLGLLAAFGVEDETLKFCMYGGTILFVLAMALIWRHSFLRILILVFSMIVMWLIMSFWPSIFRRDLYYYGDHLKSEINLIAIIFSVICSSLFLGKIFKLHTSPQN